MSTARGMIEWLDAFGDDPNYAGTIANTEALMKLARNGDAAAMSYLGVCECGRTTCDH